MPFDIGIMHWWHGVDGAIDHGRVDRGWVELQELGEIPENVTISMVADSDEDPDGMQVEGDGDDDSEENNEANNKNVKMDDDDIDDI